ncbi:MAG: hypothetical protein ABH983_02000 [Candidatus Micrarchaeota archaeon]
MTYQCRIFGVDDYSRILEFYRNVDGEFYPRLSERKGGLGGHMQTIVQNGGSFAIFEENGEIHGVAGFFPLDQNREVVQFTLFSFTERYRNGIAPYRLAKYLANMRVALGYQSTRKIIARTWYEASADRLQRMGFNHVATMKGDLAPDRTSYYFEGSLDFIIENIVFV